MEEQEQTRIAQSVPCMENVNLQKGEQKDMKALEQKYLESAYDGSEVAEGTFAEIAESPEGAEGQKD